MKNVIVIGGGLAGLVTAYSLAKAGIEVTLFEKKSYPFHRVCGEYISNETLPFLKSLDLFPSELNPTFISRFQLSSVNGKSVEIGLDLGGFGISRYAFDYFLYQKAKHAGVVFYLNTEVEELFFREDKFGILADQKKFYSDVVVGSFGKRSKLDIRLNRSFIKKRSPYLGVKYHIKTEFPTDLIALHNFKNGYCGVSNVEAGKTNLCYLSHRDNLKRYKSIREMEEAVLFKNPFLKYVFNNAEFLFDKPEVINEISFETKSPVHDHVLMVGDAAGMITPLCGNGMAMAIHAAKILSEEVERFCVNKNYLRKQMENSYEQKWNGQFAKRLWTGRQIQKLFGSEGASNVAVAIAKNVTPLANLLVKSTHGKVF